MVDFSHFPKFDQKIDQGFAVIESLKSWGYLFINCNYERRSIKRKRDEEF